MTPAISLRSTAWIAVALLLVAAPHAERLPPWLTALTAAVFIWRLYVARMRLALPAKWLLIFLVSGGAAGIYLQYRTLFGRDAGVALLTLMIALKLMETRTQRDGMVLVFLGFFLVITNFLYTQTIPTALYLLVCVWIITAAMIGLQYTHEPTAYRSQMRTQLRTSAVILAQSVPLMVVLFILFPRVQGPLWGLPSDAYAGVTGLSDTMAPGTINKLALTDDIAFRAAFEGRPPTPNRLYWRGPVLWDFDGRTWTAARISALHPNVESRGNAVRYTVTVEPHNRRWLFALDLPSKVPPRANMTSDYQLVSFAPVNTRLRYDMESSLDYIADRDGGIMRNRALRLPRSYNPRTLEFAHNLRERFPDDTALVREVLSMFRNQNFVYTLEPPLLGTNSVDEFLFDTRRGFCEHYSSAFTVLMRAAGIPARVVTGYLGGELNPVGNYMIVRQSDAHAWTEIWLADRGWVRIDPTNAVSPARIESGIAASVPASELSRTARGDYPFLHQVQLTWDSIANTWNQTVLGYSLERQREMLYRFGLDDATWRTLAILLIGAAGAVTLVLAIMMLATRRRGARDPAAVAYEKFCAKLARAGIARNAYEGPADYAARIAVARPDLSTIVVAITRLYIALRYEKYNKNNYLRELDAQVSALRV